MNKTGTGLGLSVCKHIIEKMGGEVKVESEGIGHGTTFVIKLQSVSKVSLENTDHSINENLQKRIKDQKEALLKCQTQRIKSLQRLNLKGINQNLISNLNFLIVNDEIFILAMLEEIIHKTGVTNVDQAQNGYDGYQLVLKNTYDVILCDLNMPVMNGYQCAKKILARYAPQQSLFIPSENQQKCPLLIAYSALITDEIEAKCKEQGFDICLQSPITLKMINEQVIPLVLQRKCGPKQKKDRLNCSMPECESSSLISSQDMNEISHSMLLPDLSPTFRPIIDNNEI